MVSALTCHHHICGKHCNPIILLASPQQTTIQTSPDRAPVVWASICVEVLDLHYLCSSASSLKSSCGSTTTEYHGSPQAPSWHSMMWIDLRKPNVHLLHACVEIRAPAIELFPQTASSSISAELFDSAAGPRVGAVGWVMGVHSAAPSQPHRPGRRPQQLEVHREGGREQE